MWLLLKNLLFTLLVPGTVAVYVPLLFVRGRVPEAGPLAALGIVLMAAGAAIYAWCLWDFAAFGRGTPAPIDAPRKLVVRGLFRYTRNPFYVGITAVLLGWTALYGMPDLLVYATCVAAAFHVFVVLVEEPVLRRRFGAEYHEYCARVGRWLPRLR